MPKQVHAAAGITGFLFILVFWTSTLLSEILATPTTVAMVKGAILWGMLVLIPALILAGASGMRLGGRRGDAPAQAKKKRMPLIAANGLIVLVPSAFFLASRADAGLFDLWFYGVQALELVAGGVNLALIGLNIRDGLAMSQRLRSARNRVSAV